MQLVCSFGAWNNYKYAFVLFCVCKANGLWSAITLLFHNASSSPAVTTAACFTIASTPSFISSQHRTFIAPCNSWNCGSFFTHEIRAVRWQSFTLAIETSNDVWCQRRCTGMAFHLHNKPLQQNRTANDSVPQHWIFVTAFQGIGLSWELSYYYYYYF